MTKTRFALKVFAITMSLALLITSGAYGVEVWSNDWNWGTTPTTPTTPVPPTGNQGGSNPTGGLWSEGLWTTTPATPAPTQPTPTVPVLPKPTNPFDETNLVVMQVENNKALVKGLEKDLPVPPTIINGRLMLPLKFMGDAIGAKMVTGTAKRQL